MLCALIMAGGKGERFWPLSTDTKPKQFLNLLGNKTMIQMTVNRLMPLIPVERIFIATAERYIQLIKEQLPDLPTNNIIIEPVSKNTAPCIALSAFYINKICRDATIAVLPSDHLIIGEDKFRETLKCCGNFIEKNNDSIIAIGMKPESPETGYGYLKLSMCKKLINENKTIYKVEKFVEKPCLERAEEYIKYDDYLWNCGMYIWKADNIINLTRKYLSDTYEILSEIAITSDENYSKVLEEKYKNVDCVSVDYGIMEKAENIYAVKGNFGWDDIGSWSSVNRHHKKDDFENIMININGKIDSVNCKDNIVISNGKNIMLYDINNMVIVENNDTIFITNKSNLDRINKFKDIFNRLVDL